MALASAGLKTHIWNNNFKSVVLLCLYPVILLGLFWAIAFFIGFLGPIPAGVDATAVSSSFAVRALADFWPLIITAVGIWFMIAWFFHSSMIRKLSHSHPVTRKEEPELYNMLENLSITAGIPTPRLEIIETHARNAFASGIDQKSFTVTVTRGLMNSLSKDELEAVLAHELAHILNRDVRLLIITVIFTGMIGFLAQMAWSSIRYGFIFSGNSRNKGGGILVILGIAVILGIGYLATLLMRFAISRRREYMADAGAVELTKNPSAMMRALMRISGRAKIPETTDDIAMMCIENAKPFLGMFATHPPIEKRIQALAATTGESIPDSASLPPVQKSEQFGQRSSDNSNPWLTRTRGKRRNMPWGSQ
ncbi:MAG: M48 family metallopeptidase [Alphaproteobacteria bacterium]